MPLPASFAREGFVTPDKGRVRMKLRNGKLLKPLMIGTQGRTNSGKTEFIWSCPGPGISIVLDRMYEAGLDNPNPPAARNLDNWAVKVINVPPNTTATQATYLEYFQAVRKAYYAALANPDVVTVCVDGDSDFWELQRLAEHGKTTGVYPATRYTDVYAARRAMTARAADSGKIIIGTNKVKEEYKDIIGPNGEPVKETDGSNKRAKTGNYERQGFPDQDYLWNIQIEHIYKPPTWNEKLQREIPQNWGIKILKCKSDTSLQGLTLWGEDANFAGLVQTIYPKIDPAEFGL